MGRPAVLFLLALALAAAGCGGDDDGDDVAAGGGETTVENQEGAGCSTADAPEPRADGGQEAPGEGDALDPAKTYRLTFSTNCGSFVVTLDVESAPSTTASLVKLARDGFFDGTIFHRIVPDFVIQGGDPTQSGSGGPGYTTVDPPPSDAAYTKGVVAMAKTEAEAPGTSGSQFFVVTAADAGLPPDYAVVGEVTDGLDVVDLIGTLGDASQQPTQTVLVDEVTVSEP
jgi:cyclophilin family peptidyl-prolyl cis-trans isomerase